MTKITVYDTYLHKDIAFYTNKDFKSKDEAEQTLRLKDSLYFLIVKIEPVSHIKRTLISIFYAGTQFIEDVLYFNVKYLVI